MVLPPALLPPRPEACSPKEGQGLQKSEMKGDEEQCQEILDMRDLAAVISDLQTFPQTTNSSTWEWDRAVILRQGSVTGDYFM